MDYAYICQTHGYFCKWCRGKPKIETVCPKCNQKCRVVQEKQALFNSIAYKEELNGLFRTA